MVILGDAGINFAGGARDDMVKCGLKNLPITLLCIHGNHEMRPESVGGYEETEWHGGIVYAEPAYPYLLFAKDGEIYDIAHQRPRLTRTRWRYEEKTPLLPPEIRTA